jgi:hypothetical protein
MYACKEPVGGNGSDWPHLLVNEALVLVVGYLEVFSSNLEVSCVAHVLAMNWG